MPVWYPQLLGDQSKSEIWEIIARVRAPVFLSKRKGIKSECERQFQSKIKSELLETE